MKWIVILIFFISAACSSKKGPELVAPDRVGFEDKKTALEALSKDQVSCEGNCSESVAAFYLYYNPVKSKQGTSHQIKLCSATLIASNKILTNKHCIEDILKAGDLCSDKVFAEFKFPQTKDKPFATYKCKKVLSTSEDYFLIDPSTKATKKKRQVPDWAVIELTESVKDRKPVAVGDEVAEEDYLPVTLYPVYFNVQARPARGVIKEVRCQRVFNKGGLHIFSNDSASPLFRIENCSQQLVYGNSGTGVFYDNSTQLLGVMATADSINASGTMAHCLPDFKSPQAQCIFPNDQEFTNIMKTISFINRLHKSILSSLENSPLWSAMSSIAFAEKNDVKHNSGVQVSLNDYWNQPVSYLKQKGSEKLGQKYLLALQRLLLPRLPKCFAPGLTGKVDVLMVDLDGWSKINDYQWAEKIQTDSAGKEVSFVGDLAVPQIRHSLRPVSFSVSEDKGFKVLDAVTSDLPEPVKSLMFRLPPCP